MSPIKKLMKEVLQRPQKERAVMASRLIASLEPPGPHHIEKEWKQEIQRRIREVENGQAKMIPWAQVKKEMVKIIRRHRGR
jgi:putative addiction module component (TIGR02574 family)